MKFVKPSENLPAISDKKKFYPPVKQDSSNKLRLISVISHESPGRRANPDDLGKNVDVFV